LLQQISLEEKAAILADKGKRHLSNYPTHFALVGVDLAWFWPLPHGTFDVVFV
jgi:hypothetical protein